MFYPYPSWSSKQRDEHYDTHELCEKDNRSEERPHWPQSHVKAAKEEQTLHDFRYLKVPVSDITITDFLSTNITIIWLLYVHWFHNTINA